MRHGITRWDDRRVGASPANAPSRTSFSSPGSIWRDDFGAARTHAHWLATGDVHVTIDLDDRLIGGAHLREVAARFESEPELRAISALWEGGLYGEVWRQRLLRPPVTWVGATWEWPTASGPWESQIRFLEAAVRSGHRPDQRPPCP